LRWFFAVVEELIERHFESTSEFLECFDGGDSVAILNTGDVATEQPGSFLDVALGEFLFFAQSAKAVTNNHGGIIPYR